METNRPGLSDAELIVLKALWDQGPATVRQLSAVLNRKGRRWAYTTVLTLLQRLQAKGYVTSDPSGQAHIYEAAATKDELIRSRLQNLADELCEGLPTPLVLALVEGHQFSADEIAHFRKLLDSRSGKKPSRKRGG